MRLIDADALIAILDHKQLSGIGGMIAEVFKRVIAEAPTIESSGDLISREAIKAEACKFFGHEVIFANRIDGIPNARLTHDLTHACVDLISRADAIKAVEARIKWFNGDAVEDRCKCDAFIQARDILSELPSADKVFITVPKNCSDCWDKNLHVAVDCNAKGECGEDGEKRREDCPLIRPQGEWKHTITGQPYCSICEYVYDEDEEFNPFWNYCPNCGVKIKMEE